MRIRCAKHRPITTRAHDGSENGFLVPIYSIHEGFFASDRLPQQVYLTAVAAGKTKGPHLHHIRTGAFTCVSGNIEIVVKLDGKYHTYYSGEDHDYQTVEIPTGVPAMLRNTGDRTALVLNMPYPAWTPEMKDEHGADFSDFEPDA